jgi:hypothetical protein
MKGSKSVCRAAAHHAHEKGRHPVWMAPFFKPGSKPPGGMIEDQAAGRAALA